jgi:hypothetical protein
MSNFRRINRNMDFLMPPSVDEWLPQRHFARFVVNVIEGLDLRAMTGSYRGSGGASYHPRLLLGLVIYGYATGVFSSRNRFSSRSLPRRPTTTQCFAQTVSHAVGGTTQGVGGRIRLRRCSA